VNQKDQEIHHQGQSRVQRRSQQVSYAPDLYGRLLIRHGHEY
jgi:hypothetical protein